jgi:hypothetical protein
VSEPWTLSGPFSVRFMTAESDHTQADSDFVDRHDPARVLAECAAKGRIVELADEATGLDMRVDSEWAVGARDEVAEPYVGDSILRALASVYADHADFDPRWAV